MMRKTMESMQISDENHEKRNGSITCHNTPSLIIYKDKKQEYTKMEKEGVRTVYVLH